MERIRVKASREYDVIVGRGAISLLRREAESEKRFAIVTDDNVARYHLDTLKAVLGKDDVPVFVLPHGEQSKNMGKLGDILEFFADNTLTRSDKVIAFGGGVVGDITALASAMYLRGVEFIQVATSLLSCVDSSVGGKCAVDLRAGKNLAGVFAQPSLVICDTSFLDTLPPEEFACGMAEVIKYGLGFDRSILEAAAGDVYSQIDSVVARCVTVKRDVVEADEFDLGERKKLNLGHTLAHAVEKCSDYTIPHGAAVAMGLYAFTKAFLPKEEKMLLDVLTKYSLDVNVPFSPSSLAKAAMGDKKRSGGTISLVVPEKIGKCVLRDVSVDEIEEIFQRGIG